MNEQEFWAALAPLPEPPAPLYRLYYDDIGNPLFYSMENLPGKYITIDHATFVNPPKHIKIVDEKLVVLKIANVSKLHPAGEGTPCHPGDVSVVVKETEANVKWSLK